MSFTPEMLKCYLVGGSQDVNHDPEEFIAKVALTLRMGISALQFREKGTSTLNWSDKVTLGKLLRQLTHNYQVPLLVDDDLKLAKAIDADGIHVGQSDEAIERVLAEVAPDWIVGYSCHTLTQIDYANTLKVDYIGSGPIFATQSKADADPVIGLAGLSQLVQRSKHPVVAIGGIDVANSANVLTTGAAGLSMISSILSNANPGSAIAQINSLY